MTPKGRVMMPLTTGAAPWGTFQAGRPTWIPEEQIPALLAARAVRELTPAEEKAAGQPGGADRRIRRTEERAERRERPAPAPPRDDEEQAPPAPKATGSAKAKGRKGGAAIPPPFPSGRGEA